MKNLATFRTLDLVRSLACLWIVLGHLSYPDRVVESYGHILKVCHPNGRAVATFFVVSGYCIFAAHEAALRQSESGFRFLFRRLVRIVPTFWLSIPIVALTPLMVELVAALKTGALVIPPMPYFNWGWFDWFRFLTFTKVFDGQSPLSANFTPLNAPIWALAIILQYYLVVAMSSYTRKWRPLYYGLITIASIPFLLVPSLRDSGLILAYWPHFLVGLLLYWVTSKFPDGIISHQRPQQVLAMLLLIVVAWAGYGVILSRMRADTAFNQWICPIVWSIALFLFLLALWNFDRHLRTAIERPGANLIKVFCLPLVFLSTFSYSVFLLHGKLYILGFQLVRRAVSPDSVAFVICGVLVTLLLCYAFSYFIERPFQSQSRRLKKSRAIGLPLDCHRCPTSQSDSGSGPSCHEHRLTEEYAGSPAAPEPLHDHVHRDKVVSGVDPGCRNSTAMLE